MRLGVDTAFLRMPFKQLRFFVVVLRKIVPSLWLNTGNGSPAGNVRRVGRHLHPQHDLDGTLEVKVWVDKRILRALNSGSFWDHILNADNIGKTGDELVALWNDEHPGDPIV